MDPFKKSPKFLADFRAGRAEALESVYRTFRPALRSFILRGFAFKSAGRSLYFQGLWAESDVEDIIQETFRRAFGARARSAYDGVRPYKNYLFTIARNAVITDLTQKRRLIPVGDAILRDSPSSDLTPLESWIVSERSNASEEAAEGSDDKIEGLEIYGILMAFLESLSREEAEFFRLRFLGLLSQECTAERLGWNRAKVRKLETRLRKAFLLHAKDSGYLEMRSEARLVRRVTDEEARAATFARSRQIWRERRVHEDNEFLSEAA